MGSITVRVDGRVQGVGFRSHVAATALRHGLDGETWNREDGAVEIRIGDCSPEVVESFLQEVRRGPGIVRNVTCEASPIEVEPGFRIVSGRR